MTGLGKTAKIVKYLTSGGKKLIKGETSPQIAEEYAKNLQK